MATAVNGYVENPRYVSDAVASKRDYLTAMMDPVFVRLLQQLFIHTPASGSVQPFIVKSLQSGAAGVSASASTSTAFPSADRLSAMKQYFATAVDPLLHELAKAVAKEEPDDVAAFLVSLCTKHADLEHDLIRAAAPKAPPAAAPAAAAAAAAPAASAASGSAARSSSPPRTPVDSRAARESVASATEVRFALASPSSGSPSQSPSKSGVLRCGMRLGDTHALVSMLRDADGATFTAHCIRTGLEATVHVPGSDAVLQEVLAKGTEAMYHVDQNLLLTESRSGELQLTWVPVRSSSFRTPSRGAPRTSFVGTPMETLRNGMRLGAMHVMVLLTHEPDGTSVFLVHCPRTGREASVHVSPDDETLSHVLATHGVEALYHVDQYLILTETPSGDLHLEWQPRLRPSTTPSAVAGVFLGGRYIVLSILDEPGSSDIIVKGYCLRSRAESYVRVSRGDAQFRALQSTYGRSAVYNLWRNVTVENGSTSTGAFALHWKSS